MIENCECRQCITEKAFIMVHGRMFVCPECGNKRCPRANSHKNKCTGNNEPGQEGSAYPLYKEDKKNNE